ncbi:MAG: glycosyltransferase family 2 protein [Paenibacillus sp.]|uniref:glycosyltransferase family 2 protein n=1 Tax=Paenibacillus sp. TaxID=58172 RepID=UPI0025F4A095|nr:glycosyltransferase family 2 protein [Paenibacillus sp.]MBR2563652.1 glycosyltransferase family 2 protein [Paenibacillus sp.]
MDPVFVLTDNGRNIKFKELIHFYDVKLGDTSFHTEGHPFEEIRCCVVDYIDPEDVVAAANAIRAVDPHLPLLIITDVHSSLQDQHMIQINGVGRIRLLHWNANYPDKLITDIQSLLHPEYPTKSTHIAFVLSVYNEEERFAYVESFCRKLQDYICTHVIEGSLYLIDDGSGDRTLELIQTLEKDTTLSINRINRDVSPLLNAKELGRNTRKAGTYLEGMKEVEADYFVFVDADDSFFIEDIARMINIVRLGYYDMITGTKDTSAENRPWIRVGLSFCKRLISKPFLPEGVIDSQTGLKVLSAVAVRRLFPHLKENLGLAVDLEMMFLAKRLKLRVLQLQVACIDREGSHIHIWKDSLRFLRSIADIWRLDRRIR